MKNSIYFQIVVNQLIEAGMTPDQADASATRAILFLEDSISFSTRVIELQKMRND